MVELLCLILFFRSFKYIEIDPIETPSFCFIDRTENKFVEQQFHKSIYNILEKR